MRGFLGGVAIGAVVSGMGAALVSLAVPMPASITPVDQAADDSAAATPAPAPDAPAPQEAPVEEPPVEEPAAQDEASAAQDPAPVEGSAEIARIPEVSDTPSALVAPENSESALSVPDENLPPAPDAEGAPLVAPEGAEDQSPDEAIAAPAPLEAPEPVATPDSESTDEPPSAPTVEAPSEDAPAEALAAPTEEPSSPLPEATTVAPEEQGAPDVATVAPDINAPAPSTPDKITLPQVVRPAETQPEPTPTSEDSVQQTQSDARRPTVGTPGKTLVTQGNSTDQTEPPEDTRSRFERNSEEFILLDSRPLMSIVLMDEPGSLGAEALAEFPYPLSFAIRADDPDAKSKAAARRAAGFEVLMLVDLGAEATPKDAEMAMEVWLPQMPEAVGLIEGVDSGFQGTRALADQVAALAASEGLGLVTQANGFNTVQKLAARDGVPAGVVFRDFDGAGQDPRAIRRFLDQAAFRANQEGAVIMLGRLQPDTISALLLWGLQDRASRVQLAPISASLSSAAVE